jgi:hypothetical protein
MPEVSAKICINWNSTRTNADLIDFHGFYQKTLHKISLSQKLEKIRLIRVCSRAIVLNF